MELLGRGLITPVVTRTAPLEDAEMLFGLLAERKLLGRAALVLAPHGDGESV